jgi:hypothetical protein
MLETDCTFTVTPKNPNEYVWFSAPWLSIDEYSNYMTHPSSDMSNCGNTYLSINGARNCGYGQFDAFIPLAAPGESVEFRLKAPYGQDLHFGPDGIIIYTGIEMPTAPTPTPFTPPSLTTDSPPNFVNMGSLYHDADICAGTYKYTATGSGSIE